MSKFTFDLTKPFAPVADVPEPNALTEISEPKKVRETPAVVFRGAQRFSDEAAAANRKLFPVISTAYSIGCEGDFYHTSHAGPGTSPWAFRHVVYLLGLLGEETHHALTGHIFGFYDARKAAWVIRKDQVTGATHDVPIVSIFELIQLLDARIAELGLDPDLIESYMNEKRTYAEREAYEALPFEQKISKFRAGDNP
jgi:hypothetical protein